MNQFQQAIEHHRAGRLRDAELGYRQCLEVNPNHPDALHLLGVIAHQFGRHDDAAVLIGRAIDINPHAAPYHGNMAEVHRARQRPDDAVECAKRAIAIQADYPEAHNNLGLALLAQQKPQDAEHALRRATELRPEFASAWNNLGHAFREQKKSDEAVDAYRAAVRLAPDMAEAHNNLGQMLLETGKPDDALIHCRESVRLRPAFAEANSNLGNAHRELGNLEAARACYNEALRLGPDIGMVRNNMAQLLQEEGRYEEAVGWYNEALELEPNSARFHCNLASAFADDENFAAAVDQYRQAIALDAESAEAWNGLGQALREVEQFDDAMHAFRKAMDIKPEFAAAHTQLGHTLAELGDLGQAERCFRSAIDLDESAHGAWVNLATHHRRSLTDDDVEHIERQLEQPRLKDGARAAVHSALAQVFDSRKQYARAAQHTREANVLQRREHSRRRREYSPDEHAEFVDQLIEGFDAGYFVRVQQIHSQREGLDTRRPVFVVGMPRSGTTLTEQILASHPAVHGAGERPFAGQSLNAVLPVSATVAQRIGGLTPDQIVELSTAYQQRLAELNSSAQRVVDKMPDNYLHLGWIHTLFPNARIIHCRRDLRSIAFSCWLTGFKSIRWANDPAHIAHRIEQYQRMMDHWSNHLPCDILHVDYEDTVTSLPVVARRLIDWVALPWDDACIDFHTTKRPVRTASISQVRQPVYSRSVERWRNYETHLPELFEPLANFLS